MNAKTRLASLSPSLALLGALAFTACGGTALLDDGGDSGTGEDTGVAACTAAAPTSHVGASIWTTCASEIVVEDKGGGFVPQPPAGSPCMLGASKYDYAAFAKTITWSACGYDNAPNQAYVLHSGVHAVSTAEAAELATVLAAVKVSDRQQCGADKSLETLSVTTSGGTREYTDDFYACQGGGKTFISGIDDVFHKFQIISDAAQK